MTQLLTVRCFRAKTNSMTYLVLKALHMVGFVAWFAGLFYIVRLFIYLAEARDKNATEQAVLIPHLELMARRLWFGITWPAMLFTLICGAGLVVVYDQWSNPWIYLKLFLVALLVLYHFVCGYLHKALRAGQSPMSGQGLRYWNEVATLLLVAIVGVAVLKTLVFTALFGGVLVGIAGSLGLGIWGYRYARQIKSTDSVN
jgi:protoporphyrinogen IX oxidase